MEQGRQDELPGPGNYASQVNEFGKSVKGGHMGSKQKTKLSGNPGPGSY